MEPTVDLAQDGTVRQLRVVHRLAAALHQADSPLAFYEQAVGAVVELLDVDRASLLLFDPDGVMRFKAWQGLSRQYRLAVEGHTPWSPDDADAEPILVPDVDADPSLVEYRPVFEAEGIRALAFVPLVHRQRLVGKFMLYHRLPHVFRAEEIAVAEVLAAHVALALERRRVEEELRREHEHLELALSAGEMGTWEWDIHSGSVSWSPTLEALHGLAPGTFAGTLEAFQADMHPDDRDRVLAAISDALASGPGSYSATYRVVREDGSIRWVSASGQLLRDGDGKPQRLLGVCGDVTDRERLLERERASAARLLGLQRVTAELSRAVTVADVAGVVLGIALRELGARSGSLCLVDGHDLVIVHSFGYPDDVMEHWNRFPIDAALPASEAVRTGRAVFLGSTRERDERYPVFAASPVVGDEAFAMIPLADGQPIGCLVLGFPQARSFSADDERFYTTLAGQCAAALARAELYEERERARRAAEQARDRLAFLADASAVLAASLDPYDTLVRLADRVVPRLADWCAIYILEDRQVIPAAIAHADPHRVEAARKLVERYPVRLSDVVGAGAVIQTGVPERHEVIGSEVLAAAAHDADHLELLRSLDVHAALTLPLVARGRILGALALVNGPDRTLDPELEALAHELAGRAAIALDTARLFQQRTAIARTLQASLLPPELPRIPGFELATRYVAGAAGVEVGGDFYDVFALDDRRFLAVVGDVCGRGVDAAALASLSRHAIRSVAVTVRSPAAILSHLNEVLLRQARPDAYEPRFCTAVVAMVERRDDGSAAMTLAAAGHPLPLLRDAAGAVRPVGSGGALVGVLPNMTLTDETFELRPGDTVVCFTDGVTERRAADGRFFGDDAFARTVAEAGAAAEAVAGAIEQAVVGFADGDPSDDLAVLVIRLRATDAAASPDQRREGLEERGRLGRMPTRVLLVEEAVELRSVIRRQLQLGGFDVVDEAGGGAAALEAALEYQPDVIVVELGLSDLAGHDLVTRLRAVSPGAQLVVYTGSSTSPPLRIGGEVAAYLTKDQSVGYLVDLLDRLDLPPYRSASIALGPDPGDVAVGRRFLAEQCGAWGCSDLTGDAELVMSELVTNALLHTGTRCEFRAGLSPTALRLQVIDGGAAVPDLKMADGDDENGRGLLLVSALCAAWGTEPLPSGGKVVWAELVRSEA